MIKINHPKIILFLIIMFTCSPSGALTNDWPLVIIDFLRVSHMTKGNNPEVIVAIIDSGIDYTHQEFDPNMVLKEYSYDFVENNVDTRPVPQGIDSDMNGITDESVSHGTFVAGIIAAQGKSMSRGLVPEIKIIDFRGLNSDGIGDLGILDQIWQRIADMVAEGVPIKLINYSIDNGVPPSPYLDSIIANLTNAGVIIVAAAGNARTSDRNIVHYPASNPNTLAVGAVDSQMELAEFSRYGENLTLVAPGKKIYSTVIDNQYYTMSGTSFAAPFVTGALAFLWSIKPTLTREEMLSLLLNSTTHLGDPGKNELFGYGLLNVTKMLLNADIDINSTATVEFSGFSLGILAFISIVKEYYKRRKKRT
jgi:subtilisin family serine protease